MFSDSWLTWLERRLRVCVVRKVTGSNPDLSIPHFVSIDGEFEFSLLKTLSIGVRRRSKVNEDEASREERQVSFRRKKKLINKLNSTSGRILFPYVCARPGVEIAIL